MPGVGVGRIEPSPHSRNIVEQVDGELCGGQEELGQQLVTVLVFTVEDGRWLIIYLYNSEPHV